VKFLRNGFINLTVGKVKFLINLQRCSLHGECRNDITEQFTGGDKDFEDNL